MLPLYDQTRRAICALLFLAVGLGPALLVAAWCAWLHRPGRQNAEAEALSRLLGLDVSIEGVQYLRPGAVRYRGVRVDEPESGRTILRCQLLETGPLATADPQPQPGGVLSISVAGGEIDAQGLDELGRLIQRMMEARTGCRDPQVRLLAGNVTLHTTEGPLDLADVQARVDSRPGEVWTSVGFRVSGLKMPKLAVIQLGRNRQSVPPSAGFRLFTGDAPLPCRLLGKGLPALGRCGPRSTFQGEVTGRELEGGWHSDLVGRLSNIDLGGLLADYPPLQLTGTGQLTLTMAQFRQGRLEVAGGEFSAGPGSINRALLTAASQRLSLPCNVEAAAAADPLPYRQLAFSSTSISRGFGCKGPVRPVPPGQSSATARPAC